mgnify:CR=1 FL=1
MRYRDWLPDIFAVEGVAAFRAEFGGMLWVLWLPAAFVAAVQGGATGAELSAIHRAAAAGPASGARAAAFRTEFAGVLRATGTGPGSRSGGCRLRSLRTAAHLV